MSLCRAHVNFGLSVQVTEKWEWMDTSHMCAAMQRDLNSGEKGEERRFRQSNQGKGRAS